MNVHETKRFQYVLQYEGSLSLYIYINIICIYIYILRIGEIACALFA